MKATINLEGRLILKAESELEGWAMQKWIDRWEHCQHVDMTGDVYSYPAESMLLICAPDPDKMGMP